MNWRLACKHLVNWSNILLVVTLRYSQHANVPWPERGAFGWSNAKATWAWEWCLRVVNPLAFENGDRIQYMRKRFPSRSCVYSLRFLAAPFCFFFFFLILYDGCIRCEFCGVSMTIWAFSTTALWAEKRGVTCVRVKRVPSDARSALRLNPRKTWFSTSSYQLNNT